MVETLLEAKLSLVLKKLDNLEQEISFLKDKYESSPQLPEDHEELLTINEACIFLKKERKALYEWRKKGLIPFQKLGGTIFFNKKDLLNYNKIAVKKSKVFR